MQPIHKTDTLALLNGLALGLGDATVKPVWIQLAKTGSFRGHPSGPFGLNAKVFAEIKRNFDAAANHQIPVDFEHASEKPVTEGAIAVDGAPAQGWIRAMKIERGNLYGLVDWGDKAREMIRARQYKYISPAIRFGSRDRETGEIVGARMSSAALTNVPFLTGMEAVAAKDTSMIDGARTTASRIADLEAQAVAVTAEIAALATARNQLADTGRRAGSPPVARAPELTLLEVAQRIQKARGGTLSSAMLVADSIARRNRAAIGRS